MFTNKEVLEKGKFEVRILRPSEWETLRDALDINMKRICTSLLVTGMRYAELQRFRENPDWLDGRFVYLPRGSMMKVKAKQKERAILRSSRPGFPVIIPLEAFLFHP